MMQASSLARYRTLQEEAITWFLAHDVTFCMPESLPTQHYADASHPLSPGYRLLAEGLSVKESFRTLFLDA